MDQIIYNCVHTYRNPYVTTASEASFKPISLNGMYELMEIFENKYRDVPNVLKVHPSTYNAIRDYFMKKELEEETWGIVKPEPTLYQSLLGVPIYIDHSLKPGEWRFEKVLKHDV